MKIGWIGLGNMGNPMSQRLIKAGYDVTVYNRSKDKTDYFRQQDVLVVDSPRELINATDMVFVMVSDDAAIRALFTGKEGLLEGAANGKIIINMSTVSPSISREMSALCSARGCDYMDAPVSGSVKPAEDGTLVIIAGGDKDVFDKVKPLFDHLGRLSVHVGGCGAGNTAKLAVNTLLGIITQGLAEVTLFAGQKGICEEDLFMIIANSALASPFIKMKSDAILQDNFKAAFALRHMSKDLRLAKAEGMDEPLGNVAYQSFQDAERAGLADEDIIAIIKHLE
ncbi:NAD(P)-dependent oxidoreductase [Microbacter margulisiae]|uniref:3-hydroxyisobutyrate dehydrogenase n=1 Tax=Microbacter margulisiae TaxID=1350067 RepID=A0A7W5DS06_9PORP|nr:NAD(P)-dependent oxidoreductase [Microbacter margulisiae]MBB3187524.1 3-hydroxyisobutyrate dehydrogenase [Microbacter margulisiae]